MLQDAESTQALTENSFGRLISGKGSRQGRGLGETALLLDDLGFRQELA